jgi:hypothetical protein
MPALSTGNPEALGTRPDGSCCYHPAVRWQHREHAKRIPERTHLALSRGEVAPGASFVDRNAVLRIAAALFESAPTPWGFVKRLATTALAHYIYQPTGRAELIFAGVVTAALLTVRTYADAAVAGAVFVSLIGG